MPVTSSAGVVRRTADQAFSDGTNLANVADLAFAVDAGHKYRFRFVVFFTAAAGTTGIVLSVNGPASPTYLQFGAIIGESATAFRTIAATVYDTALVGTNSAGTLMAIVEGVVENGANSGTLALRCRTEVNGSAVTVKRGSYGEIAEVP